MNNLDKKLYELFADKTLSEGCWIAYTEDGEKEELQLDSAYYESNGKIVCSLEVMGCIPDIIDFEILGHEPQLHDVFRVANDKEWNRGIICWDDEIKFYPYFGDTRDNRYKDGRARIPYNPTLPLLQQEDATKEQLISLFS